MVNLVPLQIFGESSLHSNRIYVYPNIQEKIM